MTPFRSVARSLGLALAVAAAVSGCSLLPRMTPLPVAGEQPFGVEVPIPPERMRLEMNNGTTSVVVLTVNGGVGRQFGPGSVANLGIAELGQLPWSAEVSTVGGRRLLGLAVNAGDVTITNEGGGQSSQLGDGVRVDLSCGRIDLWSGPPMLGPAPGPGTPGDCDP
jgi:hypothetical protein